MSIEPELHVLTLMSLAAALVAGDKRLSSWCVWKQASYLLSWCLRLCCDLNNYSSTPNGLWVNSPWVEAEGRMGYWLAYVAWRFCRAGRTSGQAAKFACEARENERRSREKKLLPPQSPRGFSALARLYYLARPTKTAMLRRLAKSSLCSQLFNFLTCMCEIRHAIHKQN